MINSPVKTSGDGRKTKEQPNVRHTGPAPPSGSPPRREGNTSIGEGASRSFHLINELLKINYCLLLFFIISTFVGLIIHQSVEFLSIPYIVVIANIIGLKYIHVTFCLPPPKKFKIIKVSINNPKKVINNKITALERDHPSHNAHEKPIIPTKTGIVNIEYPISKHLTTISRYFLKSLRGWWM
ncbi:MAG: hypothetical protein ACP5EK_03140 [Thermoplasmatota archaeon]